tara:strand:+ start:1749 stop:2171 length:423 start_codon:yes stop_codon:yes gene_type:complete
MDRVYHTWDKWECYPAGFYNSKAPNKMTKIEAEEVYRDFLSNVKEFEIVLARVVLEWKFSCEHYLTNENMNRIAWLGQACLAYKFGIPACYRGGYNLLTENQKIAADRMALKYLNNWLIGYGESAISEEEAESKTVANLY